MEIWKNIEGYIGVYQISNFGNVRSLSNGFTRKSKILKQKVDRNGYKSVSLSKNSIGKYFSIHRLVALHFLYRNDISLHVNHKDGIKTNNNLDNLEWVTRSENQKHAFSSGLNKISEKTRLLSMEATCKKVINDHNGIIYNSIKTASIESNIGYSRLYNMLNGKYPNNTSLRYL